jgi:hypothetical protein
MPTCRITHSYPYSVPGCSRKSTYELQLQIAISHQKIVLTIYSENRFRNTIHRDCSRDHTRARIALCESSGKKTVAGTRPLSRLKTSFASIMVWFRLIVRSEIIRSGVWTRLSCDPGDLRNANMARQSGYRIFMVLMHLQCHDILSRVVGTYASCHGL